MQFPWGILAIVGAATCLASTRVHAESPGQGIDPIQLHLDDELLSHHAGDIDGLYDAWIRPRLGPGNQRRTLSIHGDAEKASLEIQDGIKRFCDASGGQFKGDKVTWGWSFRCFARNGSVVGRITLEGCGGGSCLTPTLTSPGQDKLALEAIHQREREMDSLLKENGATGWLTVNGNRIPFLRIGTFQERYPACAELSAGTCVPFEDLRRLSIDNGSVEVELKAGPREVINAARLNRKKLGAYGYGLFGLSGFKALSFVLLSDEGKLYERVFDNLGGIRRIEIDPDYVPIPLQAGKIPEPVLAAGMEKIRPLLEKRRQAELALQKEREKIARQEDQRNAEFRKTLKIGTDTFCGPVIELRRPMVKIAVNVQLQGFGTEAWLKESQIYPAYCGCRNINGQLSPLN